MTIDDTNNVVYYVRYYPNGTVRTDTGGEKIRYWRPGGSLSDRESRESVEWMLHYAAKEPGIAMWLNGEWIQMGVFSIDILNHIYKLLIEVDMSIAHYIHSDLWEENHINTN